jgi:hypothetical protein
LMAKQKIHRLKWSDKCPPLTPLNRSLFTNLSKNLVSCLWRKIWCNQLSFNEWDLICMLIGVFVTNSGWISLSQMMLIMGENGTDIFWLYSRPDLFRGVQICLWPSLGIQRPIRYLYPNAQIVYLWCRYSIISYPAWLTLSIFESESEQKYENKYNICRIRP